MFRRTYAEINLDHLAHNIAQIQKNFPDTFLCPMVKANAYGHGEVVVAKHLESLGIRQIGVCTIDEGVAVRAGGFKSEILVFLSGDENGARQMLESKLTPVLTSWAQIAAFEKVASAPVGIHLKFDTGMHRLGFAIADATKLREHFAQNKKLIVKGICTHLHSGEDAVEADGQSAGQLRRLNEISKLFPDAILHALNSAGILSEIAIRKMNPDSTHPLRLKKWGVRPGLMIYGYNPLKDQSILDLKPVMSFKAPVATFQNVPAGDGASYNHTWKAAKDSVVAVVAAGYADGYHRILSNKGEAYFMGQRVPVVGTVCMDYLFLDVTDVVRGKNTDDLVGQEVVLFGEGGISAAELARKAQSIPWEMLTSISVRVPRVFKGKGMNA